MTTSLYEILDGDLLAEMLRDGYVKLQFHPTEPLAILNYTQKAQFEKVWNPVTRQCRGLIYNIDDFSVVARPFEKFFNVGELRDDEIPLEPFDVFEKMDGSLGVLYARPSGGHAIATRGSFESEQAMWATNFLRPWTDDRFFPDDDLTYLFEIIYPQNRIVVDYHGLSTIVLLDIIETATGESVMREAQSDWRAWPGRQVDQWDGFEVLDELLQHSEGELNREGFVIRFESGMRAKVKLDEYVRLHRILTNVSTRDVYRMLGSQAMKLNETPIKQIARALGTSVDAVENMPTVDEIVERVPDEFFAWLQGQIVRFQTEYTELEQQLWMDFGRVCWELSDKGELDFVPRKAFAAEVSDYTHKDVLFLMLDGRDYAPALWQRLLPEYGKPFAMQNEDVN